MVRTAILLAGCGEFKRLAIEGASINLLLLLALSSRVPVKGIYAFLQLYAEPFKSSRKRFVPAYEFKFLVN